MRRTPPPHSRLRICNLYVLDSGLPKHGHKGVDQLIDTGFGIRGNLETLAPNVGGCCGQSNRPHKILGEDVIAGLMSIAVDFQNLPVAGPPNKLGHDTTFVTRQRTVDVSESQGYRLYVKRFVVGRAVAFARQLARAIR